MAAEPVSPEVAPTIVTRSPRAGQLVVEQAADELQGDVLERERRAPEQLEPGTGRRRASTSGHTSGWSKVA